jgi:hypothetical protein
MSRRKEIRPPPPNSVGTSPATSRDGDGNDGVQVVTEGGFPFGRVFAFLAVSLAGLELAAGPALIIAGICWWQLFKECRHRRKNHLAASHHVDAPPDVTPNPSQPDRNATLSTDAHEFDSAKQRAVARRKWLRSYRLLAPSGLLLSGSTIATTWIGGGAIQKPMMLLCMAYCWTWIVCRKSLDELKREADLPRLTRDGGILANFSENAAETWNTDHDAIRRTSDKTGATKAEWGLAVVSTVAVLSIFGVSGFTGDASPSLVLVKVEQSASAWFFHHNHAKAIRKVTHHTLAPCGTPTQIEADIESLVPGQTGINMAAKWDRIGRTIIGCPSAAAETVGPFTVLPLAQGTDGKDYLVGDSSSAAVAMSDFQAIIRKALPNLAVVMDRIRWGLGTAQLLVYSDGSCSLLDDYETYNPVILPQSVTNLVAEYAAAHDEFPRVTGPPPGVSGTFNVRMYAAGSSSLGASERADFTVSYDSSGTATLANGLQAHDSDMCTAQVADLPTIARNLELSVDVAWGQPIPKDAPATWDLG